MVEKGTTARRILDVDVREVSLVDRAANLRQFLVIKRLEDQLMPAFEEERGQTMSDVEKAKKQSEEMTDEEKKKAKMEEEANRKAAEEEKQKAMNPDAVAGMLRSLKGAGLPKAAVDSLVSWLETQKQDDKYPSPEAKTKSLDGVQVAIMDDGGIFVAGQPVVKSKKFTESRINTVKEIVTQLMQLLNEVDQDAAKALMDGFVKEMPKGMPEGSGMSSMVRPQGTTGMQKADFDLKAELEKRDTQIANLQKRLDEALGTRQASKSVSTDGGTDTKTVKKSMWDGVL